MQQKNINKSLPSCESKVNNIITSSSSASSYDNFENNNSISNDLFSVQSSIENDDSSNEGILFPLSIAGKDWHKQEVATKITLNNKRYTNEYLEQK